MADEIRNIFISHIHEDDEGIPRLKALLAQHGMVCRNGSITTGKFNSASNEDYIKYQTLAPRIKWASVLAVYISPETKDSDWVNWEIEYAHKQGKRIVRIWEWGQKDCEPPEALKRYGDAIVGWNGESIIDAINGDEVQTDSSILATPNGQVTIPARLRRESAERGEKVSTPVSNAFKRRNGPPPNNYSKRFQRNRSVANDDSSISGDTLGKILILGGLAVVGGIALIGHLRRNRNTPQPDIHRSAPVQSRNRPVRPRRHRRRRL